MSLKLLLLKGLGTMINLVNIFAPTPSGNLSLRIFGTPPKPRIREKEAKFLAEAERIDVTFEGKNIAVYSWGDPDAPYVFTAYGWGYNAGRWRYFVPPLLEAGYRVIAYDPPGHGNSDKGLVEYPMMVRLQTQLIKQHGRPALFLGHSFGGGCFVGTLRALPRKLHPPRICLMGVFSDARWIFHNFRKALGLSRRSYLEMVRAIYRRTGRRLSTFDNALVATQLDHVECLIVHDPADKITSFSNALRNHLYWRGSYLYRASGAGHHLGTAEVTKIVMNWLINDTPPNAAERSQGTFRPDHELAAWFIPVEQDMLHGSMQSAYYA